jgi:5'-phosphate synthase pdxT subunit
VLIGVLALQGAYAAHASALRQLGVPTRLVRRPVELKGLDGLIMPGGESSTFLRHLERDGFYESLDTFLHSTPTFGTCAGAILLAKEVTNPAQRSFAAMDMDVKRNAYGRQNDSAIVSEPSSLAGTPLEMVFIRAPLITRTGPGVETLASRGGSPALVRQGHLLAATFHPELSADLRVHELFLGMVAEVAERSGAPLEEVRK